MNTLERSLIVGHKTWRRSVYKCTSGQSRPAFLFFSVVFFLFFNHLQAQQDSVTLQAVVIQATRASSSGPVPHNNLNAADIAHRNQAHDIPFLLTGIPSLVETSDAGAGVGYTGLRIRGSDPTRVNVTINGVPLNDAESQGVFWVNMPDLASSTSEIQVQRGVGTSTNGAGAFGATVNIDLSGIQVQPSAEIINTLGSFGLRKHALKIGTGALAGGRLSFSGRLSTIHSQGYIDRASAALQAVHLTGSYIDERQSVQMHLLDGRERTYQAWYGLPAQYYDSGTRRTYNVAGTERADQPHPDEVDNYRQRHHLVHYRRTFSQRLLLQLNGHYTRGAGYFEQYKAGESLEKYSMPTFSVGDTVIEKTDLIRRRWLDNHFYGGTWAILFTQGKMSWKWGGALNQYRGKHYGEVVWAALSTLPSGHRYYDNDAVKNDLNTWLQLETAHNAHFSSFADVQLRRVDYSFLGFDNALRNVSQEATLLFFNPKAGLNYAFSPKNRLYLFGGVGHREPNRDDYTQSSPESRPQAERLYNIEAGWKRGGTTWLIHLNAFGMYYKDQLVLSGRINDVGAYTRTNVDKSYRAGLETEGSWKPGRRLLLQGNCAVSTNKVLDFVEYRDNWATGVQETVVYNKTDLAFSPNLIARAEAGYQLLPVSGKQALVVSLSGKYVGRQFLDNTANEATQLKAFAFADARMNYDLKYGSQGKIQVVLAVNNILNAKYASNGWTYRYISPGYDPRQDDAYTRQESGDVYHQAGYFPQAGRNWMCTVVVGF